MCCIAFAAIAAVFTYLDVRLVPGYLPLEEAGILIALTYGTTGAFIASRQPANKVSWFLLGWGFAAGLNAVCTSYVAYGYTLHPTLPGLTLAAWLHGLLIALLVPGAYLVFMIFPNGALPSPRWRIAAGVVLAITTALVLIAVTAPTIHPNVLPSLSVPNPVGIRSLPFEAGLTWAPALPFRLLGILLCLSAIPIRLRSSTGLERQQLKYVAYVALLMVIGFAIGLAASLAGIDQAHIVLPLTAQIALAIGFPLAAGFAILRYRLYDIDALINRTVAYGIVTAVSGCRVRAREHRPPARTRGRCRRAIRRAHRSVDRCSRPRVRSATSPDPPDRRPSPAAPRAPDSALHRHRGLDADGGRARRRAMACRLESVSSNRAPRTLPLRRPRSGHHRRRVLRNIPASGRWPSGCMGDSRSSGGARPPDPDWPPCRGVCDQR